VAKCAIFFRNDNKKLAKARKIVLGDELPIPIDVYAKKLLSCEKIENGYVVSWHTDIRSTTSKRISGLMINVCHRCYVQKLHCSNGHYVQKVFDMINSRTCK